MKLLLLGATGRTGKWVLEEALMRGHAVNAIVRDDSRIAPHPSLRLFKGSPSDELLLRAALEGCEGVINTLNISRTSDFPWAPLRTPPQFLSTVMQLLIAACKAQGVQRIVVTSAWGVGNSGGEIPGWFRWFINNSNIGVAYRDHEKGEALLAASGLRWTCVRPVGLTNGKKQRAVGVSLNGEPKPSLTISRRNLARFLLDELEEGKYEGRMPVVFGK